MRLHLCIAALLVLPGPPAFAQGNPGPFGGLFGRTPERANSNFKVFDLRGSGGVQWDDAVFEQSPDRSGRPVSGTAGQSALGATFEQRSERFRMRAGSNVDYRQTLTSRPVGGTSVDGRLEASGNLTTRVSAETSVSYRYSPYFQYHSSYVGLDSGLVVPGLPYVATATANHTADARVGGSFQYSKSSTLTASVSHNQRLFPTSSETNSTTTDYHGMWQRRLNRSFSLRLGYGRSRWRQNVPGVADLVHETVDVGIDFHRGLALSRKTTMEFTTNTSIFRSPGATPRYRLDGGVALSHRFRRTWQTSLTANRGSDFVPGYTEPVFTETLGWAVGGQVADRVEWRTSVQGSRGDVGFGGGLGRYVTAGASTQLNFAVTRHVGIYSQYGFYHHDVPGQASSIAVVNRMSRQSISAGVAAWLPVFSRRSPSDSR